MNPSALSIKGLIKIHKPDQPLPHVVNWRNAPAYRLSKLFTDKIHRLAPLPNAFNIKNTHDLLRNIKDTPLLPHHFLASLDITNLYSNIPVPETKTILMSLLEQELIAPQTQQEVLKWYDVITGKNYFSHNEDVILQYGGLAMGAPSSGLIAENFLQHTEHTHIPHLTQKHKILNYCRYVDDIFLVFDSTLTNINEILQDFNGLHPKLQFAAETKKDHTLNYLDFTMHRKPTGTTTSIYRKPTFTDSIIPYTSNHTAQHKYAAVRFLFNRLDSYNLDQEEYLQE